MRHVVSADGSLWTMGRRIRAAMALAGIPSFETLAERIGHEGLGTRTLRKIADDEDPRDARRLDLIAIANACGLPYEFFTVDFSTLGAAGLNGELAAMDERLDELVAVVRTEQFARASLESALQEVVGTDLQAALAKARQQ